MTSTSSTARRTSFTALIAAAPWSAALERLFYRSPSGMSIVRGDALVVLDKKAGFLGFSREGNFLGAADLGDIIPVWTRGRFSGNHLCAERCRAGLPVRPGRQHCRTGKAPAPGLARSSGSPPIKAANSMPALPRVSLSSVLKRLSPNRRVSIIAKRWIVASRSAPGIAWPSTLTFPPAQLSIFTLTPATRTTSRPLWMRL